MTEEGIQLVACYLVICSKKREQAIRYRIGIKSYVARCGCSGCGGCGGLGTKYGGMRQEKAELR